MNLPEEPSHDLIIINPEEAGERLDKILAIRLGGKNSRTYFQYLIEEGLVLLNGQTVKKRTQPQAGDEVEIQFALTPQIEVLPEAIPLHILYEDSDIIVVNKPAGMVVHPAIGNWSGTFVNALMHHCQLSLEENSGLRPGIVHRLDKDTSGVLVAAKNSKAHQGLIQLFAQRKVHKEYLAICLGNPGNKVIQNYIGRHPGNRKCMAVVADGSGKNAITHCQTIACNGKLSVVSMILETGRTHQIRVHMKHQGTPVLGDSCYGNLHANKQYGTTRQLLHAERISFDHPISGQALDICANLPEDIAHFKKKISGLTCE